MSRSASTERIGRAQPQLASSSGAEDDPARRMMRREARAMVREALSAELDLKWLPIERRLEEALKLLEVRVAEIKRSADDAAAAAAGVEERLERRLAETDAALSKSQRRQELKLARQERDRSAKRIEQRIEDCGREAVDAIQRERSLLQQQARAEVEAAAERGVLQVQERVGRMLEAEGRLTALLDEITETAQRMHAADERAMVAMQGLISRNGAGNGRSVPQAAE